MAAASNFLENAIVNSVLRGAAFPSVAKNYIALHTVNPTDTGAGEVTTTAWPAYERMDAALGADVSTGWTAPSNGTSKNAKQLIYPVFNGTSDLTVTHFSIWDAKTGGNMLVHAVMDSPRTVQTGDVFVVDTKKLTVQVL